MLETIEPTQGAYCDNRLMLVLEPFQPEENPSPVEVFSADHYTLLDEERERDCGS